MGSRAEQALTQIGERFFLGDRLIPRVSDILKAAGRVDTRWFKDEHRLRGQAVHHAVFLEIDDDLAVDGLHPVIIPFVHGWIKFRREMNFIPEQSLCEKRMVNPNHWYVGRPDVVGLLNARPVVIDVKTGGAGDAKYQLAAYREFPEVKRFFLEHAKPRLAGAERFAVKLFPNGTYRLEPFKDPNDWLTFCRDLEAWKRAT